MKISILPVPPAALIARWAEVEPLLSAATEVNMRRYLPIDILSMCIQGVAMMQGWFVLRVSDPGEAVLEGSDLIAVLVTRVDQYPRRRGCSVFALAGERMSEWFDEAERVITDYALRVGADHFEVHGRAGWQKVLNLPVRSIFLVKDLTVNKEQARTEGAQMPVGQADGGAHA